MMLGKNINGYVLTELLGRGGMGEVYKAENKNLGRTAAIKFLYDKSHAARFQNEAYIQSSIKHRNIASLYEYTIYDNTPCIIMEYVDGFALDKILTQKHRLSSNEATHVFAQIIDGIAVLHKKNIQHRVCC